MEHILKIFSYTTWLWDSFSSIFKQCDRDRGSITNTLNHWRKNFKENEALNLAWPFTPYFIIWNIWKEINKRIFKNSKSSAQHLLDLMLKQIRETISSTVNNIPSNPPTEEEQRMIKQLGMLGITRLGRNRKDKTMV